MVALTTPAESKRIVALSQQFRSSLLSYTRRATEEERPLSAAWMPWAIRAASFGSADERQLTPMGPASGRRDTVDLASAGEAAPNSAAPSTPAPVIPAQSAAAAAGLTRPRRDRHHLMSHHPSGTRSRPPIRVGCRRDVPVPALVPQQTHERGQRLSGAAQSRSTGQIRRADPPGRSAGRQP